MWDTPRNPGWRGMPESSSRNTRSYLDAGRDNRRTNRLGARKLYSNQAHNGQQGTLGHTERKTATVTPQETAREYLRLKIKLARHVSTARNIPLGELYDTRTYETVFGLEVIVRTLCEMKVTSK